MYYPKPKYSRTAINRAGDTLLKYIKSDKPWTKAERDAIAVLSNFRSCHGYPINTFQSTLRNKLKRIDDSALVMQRLKRLSSIIFKLSRFEGMKLARMQDIGGLRAVTSTIQKAYSLRDDYLRGHSNFKHILHHWKDYIKEPKPSGYRGIHLIYKYNNDMASEYNDLFIELQIRTKIQHYWATAVETMGTFLDRSLKSSEGPRKWLDFFSLAGAAFSHLEKTAPVPGYEQLTAHQIYCRVADAVRELDIIKKLEGFTVATREVFSDKKRGAYHLIVLNMERRRLFIHSFPKAQLEKANEQYTKIEQQATGTRGVNKPLQAVLVSTSSVNELKRAYPNYFLDSRKFIIQLHRIIAEAEKRGN